MESRISCSSEPHNLPMQLPGANDRLLRHNIIAQRSRPGAQGLAALSDDEESSDDEL